MTLCWNVTKDRFQRQGWEGGAQVKDQNQLS